MLLQKAPIIRNEVNIYTNNFSVFNIGENTTDELLKYTYIYIYIYLGLLYVVHSLNSESSGTGTLPHLLLSISLFSFRSLFFFFLAVYTSSSEGFAKPATREASADNNYRDRCITIVNVFKLYSEWIVRRDVWRQRKPNVENVGNEMMLIVLRIGTLPRVPREQWELSGKNSEDSLISAVTSANHTSFQTFNCCTKQIVFAKIITRKFSLFSCPPSVTNIEGRCICPPSTKLRVQSDGFRLLFCEYNSIAGTVQKGSASCCWESEQWRAWVDLRRPFKIRIVEWIRDAPRFA